MRLRAAGLCALMLLAGCSSSGTDFREYFTAVRQAARQSVSDHAITLRQAAAIPYASMGWRLNGGPEAIIVLATDSGSEQMWTSAAHIVLQTRDGRITRTVGLPNDLAGLVPNGSPALIPPVQAPYSQRMTADFPDIGAYNTAISCRATKLGIRSVTILGKAISTRRIEESCEAPSLRWSFTNIYWADLKTGMIWRSVQNLHPRGIKLTTEILRPPG